MKALAWIGQQRTRAIAALVLIGILIPPLGALLKPYVTEAVVGLLCIAFLRIDISAVRAYLTRPRLVVLATLWTTFAVPLLFVAGTLATGTPDASPALFQGLMLQAVASPMMAAPAFAALMGLDATLVLVTLVLSTALTPISAPFFASFLSSDLSLSPLDLGLKLFAILAGSAIAGLLLRRVMGKERIASRRDEIDGVNIIVLFVFVSAVMGEIGVEFLERPGLMLRLVALAFVVFALLVAVTYFVFRAFGPDRAFAIAMLTSQRNMGLMLAGTGGLVPNLTWLYFAVAQFPIYFSPMMLHPVAKHLKSGKDG
ncbi:sodium:proton symporter [uncultured Litoreibacter sp.]|uniref:sodium:proton symporter n=1 Tax=uncultured Litoreibacter sp. TaxID=1392394 RepID=UPI00260C2FE3|nr:sodium:proton symporter [uncultured Litoreibacter sp.]